MRSIFIQRANNSENFTLTNLSKIIYTIKDQQIEYTKYKLIEMNTKSTEHPPQEHVEHVLRVRT